MNAPKCAPAQSVDGDVNSAAPTASEVLRTSIRQMIRDSGLKQVFIAERLGITPKHMSQLVLGKAR